MNVVGPISDRATFSLLRRSGRRVHRGPITVTFTYNNDEVRPRVAYSLGRRVGGAVQRNRLRRRLRALISELGPGMVPGAYLIGADPAAKDMSFEELRTLLRQATTAVVANPAPA